MENWTHFFKMSEESQSNAPSKIAATGSLWSNSNSIQNFPVLNELTIQNLNLLKIEFVSTAKKILDTGFDGVELNIDIGYILGRFLSPFYNNRKDRYGGNIKNRSRFVIEVVTAIIEAIGKEKIAICLSNYIENDAFYAEIDATYVYLSGKFNKLGIAYIRLVDNNTKRSLMIPLKFKHLIHNNFKNSIILSGWI